LLAARLCCGNKRCAQHLSYFLELAELANSELKGHRQGAWLNELGQERDNLYEALEWTIATNQASAALQLGENLSWFWFMRSDFNVARHRRIGVRKRCRTRTRADDGAGN